MLEKNVAVQARVNVFPKHMRKHLSDHFKGLSQVKGVSVLNTERIHAYDSRG